LGATVAGAALLLVFPLTVIPVSGFLVFL